MMERLRSFLDSLLTDKGPSEEPKEVKEEVYFVGKNGREAIKNYIAESGGVVNLAAIVGFMTTREGRSYVVDEAGQILVPEVAEPLDFWTALEQQGAARLRTNFNDGSFYELFIETRGELPPP